MGTVTELQEKARNLESVEDPTAALEIYEELLERYEKDPSTLSDAPNLYVRVGDLRARLGRSAQAFAAYHQAAEHFALRGSAGLVSNLCDRMTHLSPAAADVYARYARRLNDYGYADSALAVLKDYAGASGLVAVSNAVSAAQAQARAGSSPQLKELLDRISKASLQEKPRRGNPTSQEPTPLESAEPKAAPGKNDNGPRRGGDGASFKWIYAAGAAALTIVVVVALGQSRERANPVESTPSVTLRGLEARAPVRIARTGESNPNVGVPDPLTESTPARTASATVPASSRPVDRDRGETGSRPATNETVRVLDDPVVAGALPIRRMSEVEFRGQRGFRVVHLLDSGAEFTVESYPVDSTTARYRVGTVIVSRADADMTVSIVRLDEEHVVYSSGAISADEARVLTCMLRVRESSY